MKKYIFLIIFFIACLEKPKLPEWDIELTIPLLEKEITIFSFLDTHYFVFNSDSTINFFYQSDFDTIFPLAKFNFNIEGFDNFYYFNNFEIRDTFFTEITIDVEEILGIVIPDSFIILPPLNYQRNLEKVANLNNFRRGFIEEAFLILNIENNSPINFEYFDINLSNLCCHLGKLEPYFQEEETQIVDNLSISSPFSLLLSFNIFTEESLLVRKRDYLKLVLKFTNVKLTEGELKFKNAILNLNFNHLLKSSSTFDLDYGEIKEGYFDLDFVNQFPFPLSISLKIKEINCEDDFNIPGYSGKRTSFSLYGKIIKPNSPNRKGEFILPIEINAQIPDTENFYNFNKENYFSFSGQIRDLKFKKIEGTFLSPFYFLNDRDSIMIDFLGNPKGIKFERAEVFIDFVYNTKSPIEIFLVGKSINRNQKACSLKRRIELPALNGQPLNRIREEIDITDLINNGPKILEFNYSGKIKGKGKIEEKDFILLNASIEIPLKISFEKDTFVAYEREIFIDKEKGEKINENLVGGELVVDVVNHFPIGFDGWIILKSEEGDSISFPFNLASGIISEKGCCVKERESKIILEMKEEQLEIFKKERLKTLLKINLPESDTVFIRPKDFLNFQSYAVLRINTKEVVNSIKR